MSSKCNLQEVLYAVVAAVVAAAFCGGLVGTLMTSVGLPPYRGDLVAALMLIATGLVSVAVGADKRAVVVIGTIGTFIVLTAQQDAMVRYMTFAGVLFAIGIYGMVVSRNAIRMLISIELMINAANINFVTFARYMDPLEIKGQLFAIFVLAVAAAEAAVGLAIVLAIYRNMSTVDMEKFNLLKW